MLGLYSYPIPTSICTNKMPREDEQRAPPRLSDLRYVDLMTLVRTRTCQSPSVRRLMASRLVLVDWYASHPTRVFAQRWYTTR